MMQNLVLMEILEHIKGHNFIALKRRNQKHDISRIVIVNKAFEQPKLNLRIPNISSAMIKKLISTISLVTFKIFFMKICIEPKKQ